MNQNEDENKNKEIDTDKDNETKKDKEDSKFDEQEIDELVSSLMDMLEESGIDIKEEIEVEVKEDKEDKEDKENKDNKDKKIKKKKNKKLNNLKRDIQYSLDKMTRIFPNIFLDYLTILILQLLIFSFLFLVLKPINGKFWVFLLFSITYSTLDYFGLYFVNKNLTINIPFFIKFPLIHLIVFVLTTLFYYELALINILSYGFLSLSLIILLVLSFILKGFIRKWVMYLKFRKKVKNVKS